MNGPVKIPRETLQKVLDYLTEKPFKEVAPMLNEIGMLIQDADRLEASKAEIKAEAMKKTQEAMSDNGKSRLAEVAK